MRCTEHNPLPVYTTFHFNDKYGRRQKWTYRAYVHCSACKAITEIAEPKPPYSEMSAGVAAEIRAALAQQPSEDKEVV